MANTVVLDWYENHTIMVFCMIHLVQMQLYQKIRMRIFFIYLNELN